MQVTDTGAVDDSVTAYPSPPSTAHRHTQGRLTKIHPREAQPGIRTTLLVGKLRHEIAFIQEGPRPVVSAKVLTVHD